MSKCFHDLARDFVMDFRQREFGYFEPRFSRASPRKIEQAAWAYSPTDANCVILLGSESICNAASAAAQSAEETLRAKSWDKRAISGAVVCFTRSSEQSFILFQFGPPRQALLDERIERCICFDERERGKICIQSDQFDGWIKMQ